MGSSSGVGKLMESEAMELVLVNTVLENWWFVIDVMKCKVIQMQDLKSGLLRTYINIHFTFRIYWTDYNQVVTFDHYIVFNPQHIYNIQTIFLNRQLLKQGCTTPWGPMSSSSVFSLINLNNFSVPTHFHQNNKLQRKFHIMGQYATAHKISPTYSVYPCSCVIFVCSRNFHWQT